MRRVRLVAPSGELIVVRSNDITFVVGNGAEGWTNDATRPPKVMFVSLSHQGVLVDVPASWLQTVSVE